MLGLEKRACFSVAGYLLMEDTDYGFARMRDRPTARSDRMSLGARMLTRMPADRFRPGYSPPSLSGVELPPVDDDVVNDVPLVFAEVLVERQHLEVCSGTHVTPPEAAQSRSSES
jgi:hypothetical protein